jgi:type IV pilus assembly protein PilM
MFNIFSKKRLSPIGIDIGTRSVKLVQLSNDRTRLQDVSRWDIPTAIDGEETQSREEVLINTIQRAREGRNFRGRDAVVCLTNDQLFLQNLRLPKASTVPLENQIKTEIASRAPFPIEDAEIRHIETADVRQGDEVLKEVLVLAAQKTDINSVLETVEAAGLRPLALDVEPAALARSYASQFRRDEDLDQRSLLVQIGYARTIVVIAQHDHLMFVKYVDVGGKDFDQAVANQLGITLLDAATLRRQSADRRAEQQDPEINRIVTEAMRTPLKKLIDELAMCVRYYSVTFRGQPLARTILSGGEAAAPLATELENRLGIATRVSDPLRAFPTDVDGGRRGQWDIALGLSLREVD